MSILMYLKLRTGVPPNSDQHKNSTFCSTFNILELHFEDTIFSRFFISMKYCAPFYFYTIQFSLSDSVYL